MPSMRRAFGAVAAVLTLSSVGVVATASPVVAEDRIGIGEGDCQIGVFGRVWPAPPPVAPSWMEGHHLVLWSGDSGFSIVGSCVFGTPLEAAAKYKQLRVLAPRGWGRRTPGHLLPGVDEDGFVNQWIDTTTDRFLASCDAAPGTGSFADWDMRQGFAPRCRDRDNWLQPYLRPILTSWEQVPQGVRTAFRVDVEPTPDCRPGESGELGAGAGSYLCPARVSDTAPQWARFAIPRFGWGVSLSGPSGGTIAGTDEYGHYPMSGTEAPPEASGPLVTESGGAVPLSPIETLPPGSGGWGEVLGDCKITGWVLKNITDGRQWTDQSPDRSEIIATNNHDHELTVKFSGTPETIRAKMRRNGSDVWVKQVFRPSTSPVKFSFKGDGQRGQLSVSCIGGDGELSPGGQTVVTHEPETERSSLAECLGQQEFTLTSPGSWVRYGVHGVGCLLAVMFQPYKPFKERLYEVRSSSEAATWVSGAVGSVKQGLDGVSSTGPGSCSGPNINQPHAGMVNIQPFDVCEGSVLHEPAGVVRRVLTGALAVAFAMKMVKITQAAIRGDGVTVYQAEFNTDTPSGTWV